MRKLLIIALGIVLIAGCSKVRPRKVKRKLAGTEWNLVSYVVGEDAKLTTLTSYTYKFEEDFVMKIQTDKELEGTWLISLDDDPAKIYLNFPKDAGLEMLTDDYQILDFDKDYMRLESLETSSVKPTTLVFRK